MADAFHYFGTDLQVSANGDILLATHTVEGQQRVIRRLLTNPGDDIWHTQYGAGLGAFVGQPERTNAIEAITKNNMYKEAIVQQNPPPSVSITGYDNGIVELQVQYVDKFQNTSVLTLPVGDGS